MLNDTVVRLGIYVAAAYVVLNFVSHRSAKESLFAALNAFFCGWIFFTENNTPLWAPIACCATLVLVSYGSLRWRRLQYWPAIMIPVTFLVAGKAGYLPAFIGLSYLAFRLSYLGYEVSISAVGMPQFRRYVGFALFPLTFSFGPISPYQFFEASLDPVERPPTPYARAFSRILVGLVKIQLFGEMMAQLSFDVLWSGGYHHGVRDLAMSSVASYLRLYFNFSGGCDLVIGAAAFLDIAIAENFDRPILARNLREFWERFHMTLTNYIRKIVYLPGTLFLTRLSDGRFVHLITVFCLFVSFLLIGVWHGTDRSFLLLGALHGLGMVVYYLFGLMVKSLPKSARRFFQTRIWTVFSTIMTFSYVSLTMILFENDWNAVVEIYGRFVLTW